MIAEATGQPSSPWIAYNFAILHVVPHVYTGAFAPVGVVLHARTAEFLAMQVLTDFAELGVRVPGVDADLLASYLRSLVAVCSGDVAAGPVALAPSSERFHWLTAPRSDVIQCGPVHEGICESPAATLDELFASFIMPLSSRHL